MRIESNDFDEKAEARTKYEKQLRAQGTLSNEEIKELADFEFQGSDSIDSIKRQIRRYYLIIKIENPKGAISFRDKIGIVGEDDQLTPDDLAKINAIVKGEISGSVLRYKGGFL